MAEHDRVQDWVDLVEELFPTADAADWDSVGLQVGDPDDPVRRVLVALDVTDATLDEAVASDAQLVLAHHPLLFRPLPRLTPSSAAGKLALRAARDRVAVLAAHTNLDVAVPGTTDPVVDALGLTDVRPLVPHPVTASVKLVTFVPEDETGAVISALSAAGAGVIGAYTECTFRVSGTGTFRPSATANPAVGEREERNEVAEHRLEVVVPAPLVADAVAALRAAHPYEEVAHDLYPVLGGIPSGKGLGRVGALPEALPLRAVADRLQEALPAPHLRVAGDLDRVVRWVAACGGAGDSHIPDALAAGADVYVTGDLRHHVTLDALTLGMALIDAGHHATEAPAMEAARQRLAAAAAERGLHAVLLRSRVRTEPWAKRTPSTDST
jgi:dinuclear metal center YbgI/SA1388 family protein